LILRPFEFPKGINPNPDISQSGKAATKKLQGIRETMKFNSWFRGFRLENSPALQRWDQGATPI